MPVPGALRGTDLGVLLPDGFGQLGLHHLVHHDEPGRRREGQPPVFDRPSHFGQGHRRFQRQVSHTGQLLRLSDAHNSYLLRHGGPLPKRVTWSCPIPTSRPVSGGGPPPYFNNVRDTLFRVVAEGPLRAELAVGRGSVAMARLPRVLLFPSPSPDVDHVMGDKHSFPDVDRLRPSWGGIEGAAPDRLEAPCHR